MLSDFQSDEYPIQVKCGFEIKYCTKPKSRRDLSALGRELYDLWGPGELVCHNPDEDPDRWEWEPK